MTVTTVRATSTADATSAWLGFRTGLWQQEINVRDFIQQNYQPYDGDGSFLAPAAVRTQKIWNGLEAPFVEERKKDVLDVSQIPSSIAAHGPGYIDKDHEIIVGLQTEAPLKRAIMPNGGFRLVASALKTYGYEPDPAVVQAFTKYRKTHNEAVFDAYTPDIRKCRSSHVLTGLPDAYGRGRIIGDYRRVALYGVTRLIERKRKEKAALDASRSSDEVIRDREELAEQIRALEELITMAASYGCDITGPARTATEAVQWLYFGYLAGVKEQNGAAMSLGRTSTFLDIYFERDLAAGTLDEEQAQEIIDDFVIKLRIVRFLRTPEFGDMGFLHSFTTGSTLDGPGVRVVAWTAGCMWRCRYCHNPDTWTMTNGLPVTLTKAAEELRKYRHGLKVMSGGLTISGGEPLMQHRFVAKFFAAAKVMGVHTALDTNGYYGDRLSDPELDDIDLVLLDIKAWDPDRHRRLTGMDVGPTLAFARRLAARRRPVWVRYVLVPGLTDDFGEIEQIANYTADLGNVERVDVLPFHQMGRYKWHRLGVPYTLEEVNPPDNELVERACAVFRSAGLQAH